MTAVEPEPLTIDDVTPTDWLTYGRAAQALGISARTVLRGVKSGEIEVSRFGKISGREVLRLAGRSFLSRPQRPGQRAAKYAKATAECRRLAKIVPGQGRAGR